MTAARDPSATEIRLSAMSPEKVADVLRRAGSRHATPDAVRADIGSGAPVNPDGTINLLEYGAWLVREMAHGD